MPNSQFTWFNTGIMWEQCVKQCGNSMWFSYKKVSYLQCIPRKGLRSGFSKTLWIVKISLKRFYLYSSLKGNPLFYKMNIWILPFFNFKLNFLKFSVEQRANHITWSFKWFLPQVTPVTISHCVLSALAFTSYVSYFYWFIDWLLDFIFFFQFHLHSWYSSFDFVWFLLQILLLSYLVCVLITWLLCVLF